MYNNDHSIIYYIMEKHINIVIIVGLRMKAEDSWPDVNVCLVFLLISETPADPETLSLSVIGCVWESFPFLSVPEHLIELRPCWSCFLLPGVFCLHRFLVLQFRSVSSHSGSSWVVKLLRISPLLLDRPCNDAVELPRPTECG